ncbi:hypothetical protein ACRRS0_16755 [Agarivorans sp. QJM3NY_29]|uniref:hypothetical protein n=1 Tax=unclassified Agarivorans TaxID=2636026 RepID=UPI003D7EC4C0
MPTKVEDQNVRRIVYLYELDLYQQLQHSQEHRMHRFQSLHTYCLLLDANTAQQLLL